MPLFPCPYARSSSGLAAWRLGWPVQGVSVLKGHHVQGVAHCVCDQHSAAAMVKVPTGETTLDIDTKLAEDYCLLFLT